jgi:hypothetical protein
MDAVLIQYTELRFPLRQAGAKPLADVPQPSISAFFPWHRPLALLQQLSRGDRGSFIAFLSFHIRCFSPPGCRLFHPNCYAYLMQQAVDYRPLPFT